MFGLLPNGDIDLKKIATGVSAMSPENGCQAPAEIAAVKWTRGDLGERKRHQGVRNTGRDGEA